MDFDDLTQPTQNTQGVVDPRRMGRENSGLCDADVSDIICILHPCSPAAFKVVAFTAEKSPHNVLQNNGFDNYEDGLTQLDVEEQETFILTGDAPHQPMDLALRFSTKTKDPKLGFVFGRNANSCDIVLATDAHRRVSNVHFSIFLNDSGVLMLRDMSTNGTIVDEVLLNGKRAPSPQTRMLNPASVIQILSPKSDDIVKFIVRLPSREGHYPEYEAKFQAYMRDIIMFEAEARANNMLARPHPQAHLKTQHGGSLAKAPLVQNQYGMHWSGGSKYNIVGLIGKGAFATVFQIATKSEGQVFAAKELEKRRFIKNGVLDQKLDNEMQIMRTLSHKNIVQYVDYQDHENHLYIIMEFVPCGDVQQYLKNNGPMHEDVARDMSEQILDALAYLHRMKITHRDIKPDNILIANADPTEFTVKLSDFGLSKVVKDKDTFLKTFCGTLLYCAPEVFPQYDNHIAGKGKKRPRRGSAQQPTRFHSYSQSVDVWSYGAVLWYSLCLRPPFEGVADKNGNGMFDKIMMTPLDSADLREQRVSGEAITLLIDMLNTDPAARPSPAACLRYGWFSDITQPKEPPKEDGLHPIAEEGEAEAEDGPDVSGLSIDEEGSRRLSQTSEVSIHSGSLEFLDPRQSKRFKSDIYAYRDPDEMIHSSPEVLYESIPIIHQPEAGQAPTAHARSHPKLFGEISQSALQSSALLGRRAMDAVELSESEEEAPSESGEGVHHAENVVMSSPSLLGAESLVREMKMASPAASHGEHGEPVTPKLPGNSYAKANQGGASNEQDDTTPRQPQRPFNRQINLPIPVSFWYEAGDHSTYNLEYANKKSGMDYLSNGGAPLLPPTEIHLRPATSGSATEDDLDLDQGATTEPDETSLHAPSSQFIKPPPRLGKLTSTSDSCMPITLNLSSRMSSWGRAPENTHSYADKHDIRVPKIGIVVWFHAAGILDLAEDDQSWLKLPDLHCLIQTKSRSGLWINGVELKQGEPGKAKFGRIYTGDEVVIFQKNNDGGPGLKFTCEFYHGEAKDKRPESQPRFVVQTEGMPYKEKGKEKGKEKENVPTTKSATL